MLRKATIAGDVAGLFFPQLAELGLRVEATVSPRVERKMVYAGANSTSFQQARKDLRNLADLEIKTERIRRATTRNGRDPRDTGIQQGYRTGIQGQSIILGDTRIPRTDRFQICVCLSYLYRVETAV